MDQSKKIFDNFICIWKWFLSLFVVMFGAYFIFHCVNMFCVEKQVSEFLVTHFGYLRELPVLATHFGNLPSHEMQVTSSSKSFCDSSCDSLASHENFRDSPSHKTPRNNFLKSFSWETCFKPLPSPFKPLFQYFYIKT